jgi:hypothetical protein
MLAQSCLFRLSMNVWILVLLFQIIYCAQSQPSDARGPPSQTLRSECKDDIEEYCPGQIGAFAYACLEVYKAKLSASCKVYLGKTLMTITCHLLSRHVEIVL